MTTTTIEKFNDADRIAQNFDRLAVEKFNYDNRIVRNFGIATVIWGIVGMLVGLLISLQLVFPNLNFDIPWLTFGRLRPLHTNAVIFAFVGNGIFMGVYYSLQRLCKARMFSDRLSKSHFWGWQFIILLAAISLPLGITSSNDVGLVKKDYYADDLAYQVHFNKVQNEKSSVERLKISRDTEGSLFLSFPKNQVFPNGSVTFFRPSKMGIDQTFAIKTTADNTMRIPTHNLMNGLWKIQINWSANGTAFYREEAITL